MNIIVQGMSAFMKMKTMQWSKALSMNTKKRVTRDYVELVLLNGCEIWSVTKSDKGFLQLLATGVQCFFVQALPAKSVFL